MKRDLPCCDYGTPNVERFNILNIQYSITKIQHSIITNPIFSIKFQNSNSTENAIFNGNLIMFNIHKFRYPEFNVQW